MKLLGHLRLDLRRQLVVMAARQRLQTRPSALINRALYDELGGAEKILNTYLDKVVEEAGLSRALDAAMVRTVLAQLAEWEHEPPGPIIPGLSMVLTATCALSPPRQTQGFLAAAG